MPHTKHVMPELSSGSMADIAFLLLTFYMMTTVIAERKGLTLMLPPYLDAPITEPVHARNLFAIYINSKDRIMVEGREVESLDGIKDRIIEFILNNGRNNQLSDNPERAVVSIKTARGTTYKTFLNALDVAQAAYYQIYSDRVGVTATAFRQLDLTNPLDKKVYTKAREGIPMNISIAEPTVTN